MFAVITLVIVLGKHRSLAIQSLENGDSFTASSICFSNHNERGFELETECADAKAEFLHAAGKAMTINVEEVKSWQSVFLSPLQVARTLIRRICKLPKTTAGCNLQAA